MRDLVFDTSSIITLSLNSLHGKLNQLTKKVGNMEKIGWSKNKAKKVIKTMCYFWGNTALPYFIGYVIRLMTNNFGELNGNGFDNFMCAFMGYLIGLAIVWVLYLFGFILKWILEWINDENESI